MSNFPSFIRTQTPGAPMPRPIQTKPLNLSPLLQLAAQPKATRSGKAGSGKGSDDVPDIDALPGHASQLYNRILGAKAEKNRLAQTWGLETAMTMPEWSAANSAIENAYNRADLEFAEHHKASHGLYEKKVNEKGAGGLYHLGEFHRSSGKNTLQHKDWLHVQAHGDSGTLGGSGNYGLGYQDDFDYNPNFYNMDDAKKYLDDVFNPAMNKYQTSSIHENFYDYQASSAANAMRGIMSKKYKAEDNQKQLDVAFAQAMREAGVAQGEQSYFMATGWDESSPLVQGLEQGFLQQTQGGHSYKGKNLRNKDGSINVENYAESFGEFAVGFMKAHRDKRYDENKELDKQFYDQDTELYKAGLAADEMAELLVTDYQQDFAYQQEGTYEGYTRTPGKAVEDFFGVLSYAGITTTGIIDREEMSDGSMTYTLPQGHEAATKELFNKIDNMPNLSDEQKAMAKQQVRIAKESVREGVASNPAKYNQHAVYTGGEWNLNQTPILHDTLEDDWKDRALNDVNNTYVTDGSGNYFDPHQLSGVITEVTYDGKIMKAPGIPNWFNAGYNTGDPNLNVQNPSTQEWLVKDGVVQISGTYQPNWEPGKPDFSKDVSASGGLFRPMDREQEMSRYETVYADDGRNPVIPYVANTSKMVGVDMTWSKETHGDNWKEIMKRDMEGMRYNKERRYVYPKAKRMQEIKEAEQIIMEGQPGWVTKTGVIGRQAQQGFSALSAEGQRKLIQAARDKGVSDKGIARIRSAGNYDETIQVISDDLKWQKELQSNGGNADAARKAANKMNQAAMEQATWLDKNGNIDPEFKRRTNGRDIENGYTMRVYMPTHDKDAKAISKNNSLSVGKSYKYYGGRALGINSGVNFATKTPGVTLSNQPTTTVARENKKTEAFNYFFSK